MKGELLGTIKPGDMVRLQHVCTTGYEFVHSMYMGSPGREDDWYIVMTNRPVPTCLVVSVESSGVRVLQGAKLFHLSQGWIDLCNETSTESWWLQKV